MPSSKLKKPLDAAIYATVALGPLLLAQVYGAVPSWLLYSLLAGWLAYAAAAAAVVKGRRSGYALALVLALLVLAVSLPQPEHYAFARSGDVLAEATFVVGSALQVVVIALASVSLLRSRA
ncbi:MAG: hypothetical protein JRN29_01705 [Nitrososphaerota archaeon]|nr:hypothetical protein [Nitrososphaerota archaeon]